MVQVNSSIKPVSKTIVFRSMADRGNFNKNFFEIIYLFVSFSVTPFIPISFDLSVCAEKNYTMLNYEKQSCPRFRLLHSNGKTVCTTSAAVGRFYGGSAPAPPTSPKEQNGMLRNRA